MRCLGKNSPIFWFKNVIYRGSFIDPAVIICCHFHCLLAVDRYGKEKWQKLPQKISHFPKLGSAKPKISKNRHIGSGRTFFLFQSQVWEEKLEKKIENFKSELTSLREKGSKLTNFYHPERGRQKCVYMKTIFPKIDPKFCGGGSGGVWAPVLGPKIWPRCGRKKMSSVDPLNTHPRRLSHFSATLKMYKY